MKSQRYYLWGAGLAAWCLMTSPAVAQPTLVTGFEPPTYSGSAAGTILTGQDGWTLPAAGPDYNVFTYAGNAPGLPPNPSATAGTQFIGGVSAGATFARAQHLVSFTNSQWTLSYDVAHRFTGTLPTADNLGSFSLQDSVTARFFIALHTWTNLATATNWNAQFNVFDSVGVAMNNQSPGAAWVGLPVDFWFRESITVDFVTNQIMSVSLTNLATSATSTFNPTTWFMQGGAGGGAFPLPTGVRFFAGGAAGNVAGWDNLSVTPVPEPTSLVLLGVGIAGALRIRRNWKRREAVTVAN